jgi:hypothetical protein
MVVFDSDDKSDDGGKVVMNDYLVYNAVIRYEADVSRTLLVPVAY